MCKLQTVNGKWILYDLFTFLRETMIHNLSIQFFCYVRKCKNISQFYTILRKYYTIKHFVAQNGRFVWKILIINLQYVSTVKCHASIFLPSALIEYFHSMHILFAFFDERFIECWCIKLFLYYWLKKRWKFPKIFHFLYLKGIYSF